MRPKEFELLVVAALKEIPPEFQACIEGVAIEIEDVAPDEVLEDFGMEPEEALELLGLYEGIPLTEREDSHLPFELPGQERIRLFREAILDRAGNDPDAIREEIRVTLIHEIAHHFGLDEDRIDELGFA